MPSYWITSIRPSSASTPPGSSQTRTTRRASRLHGAPKPALTHYLAWPRQSGVATHRLGWYAEAADEGLAHVAPIAKARLPGDDLQRMSPLLEHQPGNLQAQPLDRLGG